MIHAIVTDIEGTTSSLGFVRDVLFPYAARELPRFVREHAGDPEVRALLHDSAAQGGVDSSDLDALIAQLLAWIEEDRKLSPLKALQGMVWATGYETGALRAHVYEDAWRNLERWSAQGLVLYVYSSGSVQAQELFFQHSERGDLRPLFSGHFDTRTGPKRDPASYRAIAAALGTPPRDILFLSDVRAELDAARQVGMHTCWVRRPENESAGFDEAGATVHPTARSFDDVVIPEQV